MLNSINISAGRKQGTSMTVRRCCLNAGGGAPVTREGGLFDVTVVYGEKNWDILGLHYFFMAKLLGYQ